MLFIFDGLSLSAVVCCNGFVWLSGFVFVCLFCCCFLLVQTKKIKLTANMLGKLSSFNSFPSFCLYYVSLNVNFGVVGFD